MDNIRDCKQQDKIKKFQEHDAILEQLAELQRQKEELKRAFQPLEAHVPDTNGHSAISSVAPQLKAEPMNQVKPKVQQPGEIDLIEL
jgi:hypothetical protein